MRKLLKLVLASPLLLWVLSASAQSPLLANCTRSANLLACVDSQGNAYSVATAGNTIYLRGFEAASHRYWAQTNSRYGQLTFFTGLASDGESWVGVQPARGLDDPQSFLKLRRERGRICMRTHERLPGLCSLMFHVERERLAR